MAKEDLTCPKCSNKPEHLYLGSDDEILGCDKCPDAHVWFFGVCEICGQDVMDENTTHVCPKRSQ